MPTEMIGYCDFEGIWYRPCTWEEYVVIINGLPYEPVPEFVAILSS